MKTSYRERDHIYGEAMLKLRTAIGLTQGRLGNLLGVSGRTVGEWEAGGCYPKPEHLKKLLALAVQHQTWAPGSEAREIRALWKVARQKILIDEHWLSALLSDQHGPLPHIPETGVEETKSLIPVRACPASLPVEHAGHETETPAHMQAMDQDTPVLQNLPFPPNPFFTGRKTELLLIAQLFEQSARIAITQPVSVSGLGGIGKTQLALEYAHRSHPHIYRCVFWVNASDKATLETSYLSLAHLLKLPEEQEREIDRIVQAVNTWLEKHPRWLLILDNADDLELARSYLPTKPRGHILLTTRSQIVGPIATLIQVETLSPEVGLLFFLCLARSVK